jgi:bifunctional non-homologous end joining protein LigD
VWAFDLLHHNGRDLRELPLVERKARLKKLIITANTAWLYYSKSFDDGIALLKASDHMRLEGIVSKRRDAPYRAGKQCGWVKVKCATSREANRERWRSSAPLIAFGRLELDDVSRTVANAYATLGRVRVE